MNPTWKSHVLKWLNCFRVGYPLKNINSILEEEFMQNVVKYLSIPQKEGANSFENLLAYLIQQYPHYSPVAHDPSDPIWCDESEVILLASLLLLHTAIYCPVEVLQKNAEEQLDETSQQCIVSFLRVSMEYGKDITRADLLNAIPPSPDLIQIELSGTPNTPKSAQLSRRTNKKHTPLKEFLSSPIAQQQGRFGDCHLRGRLAEIQHDLESEEKENAKLKHQLELCNAKIASITSKLEEKCNEVKQLEESLLTTERDEKACNAAQEHNRVVEHKMRAEISELEKLLSKLHGEMGELNDAKSSAEERALSAEQKLKSLEKRALSSEEESEILRCKVQEHEECISQLKIQCNELQMIQKDNSRFLSPTRSSAGSPMTRAQFGSPMLGTENLGQVVEYQLVEKEKEIQDLQEEVQKLQKQVVDLQDSIDVERDTFHRKQEAASRANKQLESQLSVLKKKLESHVQHLHECEKETSESQARLKAVESERDDVSHRLQVMTVKCNSNVSELNLLNEAKLALDVKVVQLSAQLRAAEEESAELRSALSKRGGEMVSLKQERDDAFEQLKAARKDCEKVELQLNGMQKKYNRLASELKCAGDDKIILEEKVSELEEKKHTVENHLADANTHMEKLEQKILALREENEKLTSQFKALTLDKHELNSCLITVAQQKENATSQVVVLSEEKVLLKTELSNISELKKNVEAELLISQEDLKRVQESLESVTAERDSLVTQIDIMRQQEEDLDANLQELMTQKRSLDRQLSKVNQERSSLEATLMSTTAQLAEIRKKKEELDENLTKKAKDFEDLSSDYLGTCEEKKKIENELAVTKETLLQLQHNFSEIKATNETLETQKVNLEAELSIATAKCETLTAEVKEIEAEKAGIEEDVFSYVARLNSSNQENSSLKITVNTLKDEIAVLSDRVERLSTTKDTLETKVLDIESVKKDLIDEKCNLEHQLKAITLEKDELQLQLCKVQNMTINLQNDIKTLEKGKQEVERQLTDQTSEAKKYISEIKTLQGQIDTQTKLISGLEQNVSDAELRTASLQDEIKTVTVQLEESTNKTTTLQANLLEHLKNIENLETEKAALHLTIKNYETEKSELLSQVKAVVLEREATLSQLELEKSCKDEAISDLERKQEYVTKLEAREQENAEKLHELDENLNVLAKEKHNLESELAKLMQEKKTMVSHLEEVQQELSERELKFRNECLSLKQDASEKHLQIEAQLNAALEKEAACRLAVKKEMNLLVSEKDAIISSLEGKVHEMQETIIQLQQQLEGTKKSLDALTSKYEQQLSECMENMKKKEEAAEQSVRLIAIEKEAVVLSHKQLSSVISENEALISDLRLQLEAAVEAKEALIEANNEGVVTDHKKLNCNMERLPEMSIRNEIQDKAESTRIEIKKELCSPQREKLDSNIKQECTGTDERALSPSKQAEMEECIQTLKEQNLDLRKQLAAACGQSKLTQLQADENFWQVDRIKTQMGHHLDGIIAQKHEVQEHLTRLQNILQEVGCATSALLAALPSNSEAVKEVTLMKNEVENKLRALDTKYASSLCGIITSTYDVLKWMEKQTKRTINISECVQDEASFLSEKDAILAAVTSVGNMLASLIPDVRGVMNSCSFLIERCETFMRAQKREDLNIKTSALNSSEFKKPTEPAVAHVRSERRLSLPNESAVPTPTDSVLRKSDLDLLQYSISAPHNGSDGSWFGGADTVQQGYDLLKSAYDSVLKQLAEIHAKLKEMQLAEVSRPLDEMEQKICKLEAEVKDLRLRPSIEEVEEKTKELHTLYNRKCEVMKSKMKQIVKEEVEKVEQDKIKSEKAICAKYGKRISEFEEHVQDLSSQLWELGEKLLQEKQDHKKTLEQMNTLRENQRRIATFTKQRSHSYDHLDKLLQDANGGDGPTTHSIPAVSLQQKLSQMKGTKTPPKTQVQPTSSMDTDTVDDSVSRCSTMMAPASMGLAFPEEDEDGEIFNNDYLTDMKEGRCRAPLNSSRLSELQYRNSLCPPHLKSSYPAETQFVDPRSCKEDELKGSQDERLRRQVKGRGTTSYKRPGPPTPSKNGRRLSLQGKEESTRRGALREHNDSTSHGSGMLRSGKTTPSRLKALFTSSKVANAATLPQYKKDENSTPVTPSSKRLSIFRRKFSSSKDNQNASTGYSSFR